MHAATVTGLSLKEWADIMGINPWDLAQFGNGFPTPNAAQCEHIFYQHPYPYDYISRDEVAATIEKAEAALADELGFWPSPVYRDDVVPVPTSLPGGFAGGGYPGGLAWPVTIGGAWTLSARTLKLPYGRIMGGGVLGRTAILDAAVIYSDADGDGVNERFTVTVPTTVTDPDEIALYNTAADRLGEDIDETWRIRPINVSIVSGTATITGHASLMGLPLKELVLNPESLDVTDTANFVTEVSVCRTFRDNSASDAAPNQGLALWDAWPGDCDTLPCTETWTPICLAERNSLGGMVAANYSDGNACVGWRQPARVRAKYLSGVPMLNGKMQRVYADLVAHLATAWLPNDKCGCERSDRILHWWRSLPTDADIDAQGSRPLTIQEINNPFGTQRGALYVFNRLKRLTLSKAGGM